MNLESLLAMELLFSNNSIPNLNFFVNPIKYKSKVLN